MTDWLRKSLSGLFGRRQSATVPEEQNAAWSFATIDGRGPLTVRLTLSPGRTTSLIPRDTLLNCGVSGAHHPYDPEHHYTAPSDAAKNPALLPALWYLRCLLPDAIHDSVTPSVRNNCTVQQPEIDNSDNGFYMRWCFGQPHDGQDGAQHRLLNDVFQAVKEKIQAAVPEVEALIAKHRGEQPPFNPGPLALMEFEMQLADSLQGDAPPIARAGRRRSDGFGLS